MSRVGIDNDLLDKECSDVRLIQISSLLPDWLTFSKALGFTDSEIRDITDNPQLSNSTHAMKVLEKWHAFKAAYHHLVKVRLDDINAAEIFKMVKGWFVCSWF